MYGNGVVESERDRGIYNKMRAIKLRGRLLLKKELEAWHHL